jgi:hypothetical protein
MCWSSCCSAVPDRPGRPVNLGSDRLDLVASRRPLPRAQPLLQDRRRRAQTSRAPGRAARSASTSLGISDGFVPGIFASLGYIIDEIVAVASGAATSELRARKLANDAWTSSVLRARLSSVGRRRRC